MLEESDFEQQGRLVECCVCAQVLPFISVMAPRVCTGKNRLMKKNWKRMRHHAASRIGTAGYEPALCATMWRFATRVSKQEAPGDRETPGASMGAVVAGLNELDGERAGGDRLARFAQVAGGALLGVGQGVDDGSDGVGSQP